MINKTIVCDKCGYIGCTVSEVIPKAEQISMKEFAAKGGSPYSLDQWSSEQRDRKWVIECSECKYKVRYIERAKVPFPTFFTSGLGDSHDG